MALGRHRHADVHHLRDQRAGDQGQPGEIDAAQAGRVVIPRHRRAAAERLAVDAGPRSLLLVTTSEITLAAAGDWAI